MPIAQNLANRHKKLTKISAIKTRLLPQFSPLVTAIDSEATPVKNYAIEPPQPIDGEFDGGAGVISFYPG